MSTPEKKAPRFYPIHSEPGVDTSPKFHRTFERMSTADLHEELELGKGGPEFQAALRAELERRAA